MPIRFEFKTDDEGSISVVVEGVAEDETYIYSVAALGEEERTWKPIPETGTTRTIPITDDLASEPAGFYVLRLYKDDDIDNAQPPQPNPDAEPREAVFQYIPKPPSTSEELPPTPTVVRLDRAASTPTTDEVLSTLVLTATTARSFAHYKAYVDPLVCVPRTGCTFGADTYAELVKATRQFLELVCSPIVDPGDVAADYLKNGRLPYVDAIAQRFPDALIGDPCSDLNPELLTEPFPIELFWSYWEEQAGLVQTLNHILARFQNRRVTRGQDPLARFDLSPLRPLRHFLWSWAEDESSRLSVRHRAAEYRYEYGLVLVGRAVPDPGYFVEANSRFLESFHTLLHEALVFFTLDDDTTVNADAFRVYNALRDTHLVLAEGASNSFGDLPTQARIEMLVMQWLLSQPEVRDFLGGKPMVPYEEPWMDRVDTMRSLAGWAPTSVTHFHELAVRGEQLLLTIRWGNWNSTTVTADSARNWARTWRNQIQRYVHAYRAATGVDLTVAPDAQQPGHLLARRVADRNRRR